MGGVDLHIPVIKNTNKEPITSDILNVDTDIPNENREKITK